VCVCVYVYVYGSAMLAHKSLIKFVMR
jgi:hypothetical protein